MEETTNNALVEQAQYEQRPYEAPVAAMRSDDTGSNTNYVLVRGTSATEGVTLYSLPSQAHNVTLARAANNALEVASTAVSSSG
jgi:hypothetical protein